MRALARALICCTGLAGCSREPAAPTSVVAQPDPLPPQTTATAVALHPNAQAWESLMLRGRFGAALETLSSFPSPTVAERIALGYAARQTGDETRARSVLGELPAEVLPRGIVESWLSAKVSTKAEETQRAQPPPPSRKKGKLACDREADWLLQQGDADAALSALDACKAPSVTRLRADANYRARHYEQAARIYAALAKAAKAPGARSLELLAARATSRAGDDAKAVSQLRDLLKKPIPAVVKSEARDLLGKLELLLGRFDDAADTYARQETQRGFQGRCVATLWAERARDAEASCRRVSQGKDKEPWWLLEALSLLNAGNVEAATRAYTDGALRDRFSLAGWIARSRLYALGKGDGTLPSLPAMAPVSSLSGPAQHLASAGLDEEAERALLDAWQALPRNARAQGHEALCAGARYLDTASKVYAHAQAHVPAKHLASDAAQDRFAWWCLFPTPYSAFVEEAARASGITPPWLWAIMRQESGFAVRVESPAGARGLMQLMAPTAEKIAGNLALDGLPDRNDPLHNIHLGGAYFARLLQQMTHPAAAVASYNAGPRKAMSWFRGREAVPLELWILSIPYAETRNYVLRVMGNFVRYAVLSGMRVEPLSLMLKKPANFAEDGVASAGDQDLY